MGKLIDLFAKIGGVGKLWGYTKGWVTYTAGLGLILVGAADLVGDLGKLLEGQSTSAVLAWIKQLPQDEGTRKILEGLVALGLRRAVSKP